MKRLASLILLLCSGCATSWPIYDRSLTRAEVRRDRQAACPLVLAVIGRMRLEA